MPKISHRRRQSNRKSHAQRKQQSTREDIEKEISSSIGDQNISFEDDSCMDIDNDIETNLNSDVECEEINNVDDKDDNDDDENQRLPWLMGKTNNIIFTHHIHGSFFSIRTINLGNTR